MKLDITRTFLTESEITAYKEKFPICESRLTKGNEEFTGWVKLPLEYDKEEFKKVIATAEKIKKQCNVFIVIGIGGSYLGARAAVEMLKKAETSTEVIFAGYNISGTYHAELLRKLEGKEVCLCIISKSGTTTEPAIAFAVLKDFMIKKYGKEEANKRIYAITDEKKGVLREETDKEGYVDFIVPDSVGGRYSVLTPVGLLPIAVAGIDVKAMLDGAKDAYKENSLIEGETSCVGCDVLDAPTQIIGDISIPPAFKYAAARNLLHVKNKKMIEIYEYYEPRLQYFTEWLKQLFGESEGKEGKGIFPASLQFSADLHSMGQFLQDGTQIFFETVLHVENPPEDLIVPESAGTLLAGRSVNSVNNAAVEGVMAAHQQSNVPIIKIDIPELSPFYFGKMVYFFEKACAVGGYLFDVNPFDQPGVESYKAEMRKAMK